MDPRARLLRLLTAPFEKGSVSRYRFPVYWLSIKGLKPWGGNTKEEDIKKSDEGGCASATG